MGCLAVLRKPWRWRRRSPVVFAMRTDTAFCSVKHTGATRTHRFEILKDLSTDHIENGNTLKTQSVCSSHMDKLPENLVSATIMRPNILSVNMMNQNRKKYVNSLHYSQISGLTPTSPLDINESQ